MKTKRKRPSLKMMLTKRRQYIKNLSDVRYWIKVSDLKLKRIGRVNNHIRICESGLSWQKRIEWLKRISEYKENRQETLDYFTVLYNCSVKAQKRMDIKSSRVQGNNNPWYDHKGKYSPFKKGSVNYSEEAIQKATKNREYTTNIEYYLRRGMGLCQAMYARHERQAVGRLDRFIERYGESEGIKKWEERQLKWQKTLNDKPIEERTRINSLKNSKGSSVSKNELELFGELGKYIKNIKRTLVLYYNQGKNYYTYDIFLDNKIIEYNGDFWHANPRVYNKSFYNKVSKKTANGIWIKENHKEIIANENSFMIHRVWELDYKNDKEGAIKECINFLAQ